MFEKIINEIRLCAKCELREKAIEQIQKIYDASIGWTFYGEPNHDVKPKYMFLMQNPGFSENPGIVMKNEFKDIERYKNDDVQLIKLMKQQILRWLVNRNSQFAHEFIRCLKDHNLISKRARAKPWQKYFGLQTSIDQSDALANYQIQCDFYNDFYVTDIVKCRALTNWLFDGKGKNCEICCKTFLTKEISKLNPEIIFCFSARTWNVFKRMYGLQDYKKVLAEHGKLISSKNEYFNYVMPLAHFSRRNFFLRDSYFYYINTGLKSYRSVR